MTKANFNESSKKEAPVEDISRENEQPDKLKKLTGGMVEKEKEIKEEKKSWETRLYEIAEMLRVENDLQFQRIIENLPFSLNIINIDGIILYANSKCMELYEVDADVIGTRTILEQWIDLEKREQWSKTLNDNGFVNDFEMHLKTSKGKEFWAIGSGIMIRYQSQSCILSAQVDITERKRIESALKISEEKYRLLTEFASDVIWVLNWTRHQYTYVSPSIYYMTGFTVEEMLKMEGIEVLSPESHLMVNQSVELHLSDFISNPDEPKSYIIEIRQNCKNGEVIWVEASVKYRYNDAGEIEIVGASRNIEERKRAEREVLFLSYHDQLTGLYNRRFYEEELERINFQRNLPITLAISDINGLKLTNDAFGHFAGDDLLKKFAFILNKELKAEDVAARIGGDEFVILFSRTDSDEAEKIIHKIKASIKKEKYENAILSVSFGFATKTKLEDDFTTLFMQAEDQMYYRKLIESANMKKETIRLAMQKLFEKNNKEHQHSERVGDLCKTIGKAMSLPEETLRDLELLGQMHDIGKIGIPQGILSKKEKLNETEWLEIKRHPEIGYQILRSVDAYVTIAEFVLSHHERVDGKGYPRNLKTHEIPLPSRILAVAEAYDSMTSMTHPNLCKDSTDKLDAINELIINSGTQFDEEIVKFFIEEVLN